MITQLGGMTPQGELRSPEHEAGREPPESRLIEDPIVSHHADLSRSRRIAAEFSVSALAAPQPSPDSIASVCRLHENLEKPRL